MTRAAALLALAIAVPAPAADWPQWRGPDRSNVSAETGLLSEWPEGGPPLVWKAAGLGDGVGPVTVSGGRVFATGARGGEEFCTARSEKDGTELWATRLGAAAKEAGVMRWLAQLCPAVDGGRVYVVTSDGDYACLAADTGEVAWRKHYRQDFGGRKAIAGWGYCDYPLVDGDRLVVCPGGDRNTVAALDKKTGEVVWACPIPGEGAAHSVLVPAEVGGVRQYVVHLGKGLYGVSADGKLLWSYTRLANRTANTHAPVVRGDQVFYANGYGAGHALVRAAKGRGGWTAEEVYFGKNAPYVQWLGSPTRVGGHVFVNTHQGLSCLEWETGRPAWAEAKLGRCTYTVADGKLFVRAQAGPVILAAADPQGYRPLGSFTPPKAAAKGLPAWTFPVVANGRLYVRSYDELLCYDVRDPDRRKRAPDAVYVPTPADVVARMLDLAAVGKADVVYDLGSGDGRVVIAAAKGYGCTAVGVEIDKDLVAGSRRAAREAGVGHLARFERGDLFEADFSAADVVALYLPSGVNARLVPKFARLKPGTRLVAHALPIPGYQPDRVVAVTSAEDDVERKVYLYTVPLKKD